MELKELLLMRAILVERVDLYLYVLDMPALVELYRKKYRAVNNQIANYYKRGEQICLSLKSKL